MKKTSVRFETGSEILSRKAKTIRVNVDGFMKFALPDVGEYFTRYFPVTEIVLPDTGGAWRLILAGVSTETWEIKLYYQLGEDTFMIWSSATGYWEPGTRLVKQMHADLDCFCDGMLQHGFPSLRTKIQPFLDAANE